MSEHAPVRIYEHQRILFDRINALPLETRLQQPVEVLPFCIRALAFCVKNNIITLGQLSAQRKRELKKIRNLGNKTIEHMEAYLNAVELGFDGRRKGQPVKEDGFVEGAKAMRKLILDRLVVLEADMETREAIRSIPIPYAEAMS